MKASCLIAIILFMNVDLYSSNTNSEPIVAAYYQNYSQYFKPTRNRPVFSPSMIDPRILTDIYYAFAYFGYVNKSLNPEDPHLTGNFSIQPTEFNDQKFLYKEIQALRKKTINDLRIFLTIGGWNFNDPNHFDGKNTYQLFSRMVSNSKNRQEFIDSAINYAHQFHFDGIDIDWEFPGDLARGGTKDDFNNFLEFLKECSKAFSEAIPKLYLSITAPPFVPYGVSKNFQEDPNLYFKWLAECATYVDRINVMAYDYHGPFNIPKITGVNAPLNRDTIAESSFYIKKTLENYLNNGVPAQKIVLAMPTFGHSYAGVKELSQYSNGPGKTFTAAGMPGPSTKQEGLLSYYEISDLISQKKFFLGLDPITNTAFSYNIDSETWISFDTPETIELKTLIVLSKQLRGAAFWSIDMDEYFWRPRYPNIQRAWNILHQN